MSNPNERISVLRGPVDFLKDSNSQVDQWVAAFSLPSESKRPLAEFLGFLQSSKLAKAVAVLGYSDQFRQRRFDMTVLLSKPVALLDPTAAEQHEQLDEACRYYDEFLQQVEPENIIGSYTPVDVAQYPTTEAFVETLSSDLPPGAMVVFADFADQPALS